MTPKLTITGTTLHLPAITVGFFGPVAEATIELTPLAGQTVRVFIDHQGRYSSDQAAPHHVWQVAELTVPSAKETKAKKGEDPHALDLSGITITVFELPEVGR